MSIDLKEMLSANPPRNGRYYVIGIDGRGGSGKTSLAEYLAGLMPDFAFINGDDYFEPTPGQVAWGDFNEDRFDSEILAPIRQAQTEFTYWPYDWHAEPHKSPREMQIDRGICIDRCFSFGFDLDYDLKIWVETPREVCLARGLARESMPKEQVTKVWRDIWQPAEDKFISSVKPLQSANIIIDGTKSFGARLKYN